MTNHPNILSVDVSKALGIHPIMLYRWRQEMREGILKDNDQEARSVSKLLEAERKIKKLEAELKREKENEKRMGSGLEKRMGSGLAIKHMWYCKT